MTAPDLRSYPPIPADGYSGPCPLTFQQERVLYLCDLDPDSSIWDINTCQRLHGRMDPSRLRRAVTLLAERHAVLRTHITRRGGEAVQTFDHDARTAVRVVDLSETAATAAPVDGVEGADTALRAMLTTICRAPIAPRVDHALLFEVVLITLGPTDHAVMLRLHHIIADAASVLILWHDLTTLYNALARGVAPITTPPPISYAQYARWQRRHFGAEQTRDQEAYWLSQFRDPPPALDLPVDTPPSPALSFNGGLAIVEMPRSLIDDFAMLSLDHRVLLFSGLFAAYLVLLQKICQQEDITVGVLFSGRHYCRALNDLVGFFVTMTAVRVPVAWNDHFDSLTRAVHRKVEEAYAMQDYPFERLIQTLAPQRGDGRVPLVRTMFNVVPDPEDEIPFEGIDKARWIDVATQTTAVQVDLIFDIHWGSKGAEIRIEHNTDIFRTATVVRLAQHYITLLRQLRGDWAVPLSHLPLMDGDEVRRLITAWTPTPTSFDDRVCIHALFERQARERPDAVAIVDNSGDRPQTISYGVADRRANRLARRLRAVGVRPDGIVAIIGRRSAQMVLGQLATLKAGGAYLPITADSPRHRIEETLRDATPQALILPDHGPGADLDDLDAGPVPVLRLSDTDAPEVEDGPLPPAAGPRHLAYVMYTSGSTGAPKGVIIEHRSVINHVTNVGVITPRPDDRLLQTGAPSFDATIFEIWAPLLHGLPLYLVADDVLLDPQALGAALARHRITLLFLTPSLLNQLADADPALFRPLRVLITGGDVASTKHIQAVQAANPALTVINAYGPTENTAYSTCHVVTGDEARSIPIGRPVPNASAHILDHDGLLAPVGVVGELFVGGVGLARGYLNRPDLTAERFVPSPFRPGERLYRTGDLARRRPDGLIEFVGRADRQVKIRGFRIEPGEVENSLLTCPGVREACVIATPGADGGTVLYAYYVADPDVTVGEVRATLAGRLPTYMVPTGYCALERMPKTTAGKIDQRALPTPRLDTGSTKAGSNAGAGPGPADVAPLTLTQSAITSIWETLLGLSTVGLHDNFFEIGGHSLKAGALARHLSATFGVAVSLRMVFDAPTVAALAEVIDGLGGLVVEEARDGVAN